MFNNKKKEQNVIYTLNTLIYDYLIKMKYEKSAKAFGIEAQLEEMKMNEGAPLLSQWYAAFHEISSVRSGISSNPGDLSRIEGIMLKLENEKKRYQQMGRVDHMGYYGMPEGMYKGHPMYYGSPYHEPRKPMEMYGRPPHRPPVRYDERIQHSNFDERQHHDERVQHYEEQIHPSPGFSERPFVLREISSFRITDSQVIYSTISREYNVMFNILNSRKVCAFNCTTMKLESELETNGKQLTEVKIRDFNDYVFIVGTFGGKELMILRYVVNESKFDIMGYLRGHSTKIISFDISDSIYSLDESFILRKWNYKGACEREEILSGNINSIFSYSDTNIILTDGLRVYLYDFEMNMEMQELYKGEVVDAKRGDDYIIFIFRDKACIVDRNLNKMKFLSVPHNGITTGCYLDGDIFLGSQQTLWYESQGRLNKVNIYEAGDIVSLESISKFKSGHMVSINSNGEFKLMCKSTNE